MMTLRILLMVMLAWTAAPSSAQSGGPAFFSPGIKLGYDFANGFAFGLEASVSLWSKGEGTYYGLSLNFDIVGGKYQRAHIGAEAGIPAIGVQWGPTWIFEKNKPARLGSTFTCYTGLFAMPYLAYTTNMPDEADGELGVLGKLPMQLNDASINL